MSNITVLNPGQPKFGINQTVYAKISATKGFIEPLYVHNIDFDPSKNMWLYSFRQDLLVTSQPVRMVPAKLHENQILTFCEALDIQIGVLETDYNVAVADFTSLCPNGVPAYAQQKVYEDNKFVTQPPKPRWGFNDVAYVMDTAQSSGRLEGLRITDVTWNNGRKEWLYVFQLKARPEHSMTIGDADNWRRPPALGYCESELGTVCEAQQQVVLFLQEALTRASARRDRYCTATSE